MVGEQPASPSAATTPVSTTPETSLPGHTAAAVTSSAADTTDKHDTPADGVLRRLALRRSPLDSELADATRAALRKLQGLVHIVVPAKAALAAKRQALRNADDDEWTAPVREETAVQVPAPSPPTAQPPIVDRPISPSVDVVVQRAASPATAPKSPSPPQSPPPVARAESPPVPATQAPAALVLPELDGDKMHSYGSDRERQLAEADVEGTQKQLGTLSFDFSW